MKWMRLLQLTATYVNSEAQDFYVMRAWAKLNEAGYKINLNVSEETIKNKYNNLEYNSLASIFKGLIIMDIYKSTLKRLLTP